MARLFARGSMGPLAALVMLLLPACGDISLRDGTYACDPDASNSCPARFSCHYSESAQEYRCVENGNESQCGNSLVEAGEECDGENLGGRTCWNLGYSGGTLACQANCLLDETGCLVPCGDGMCDTAHESVDLCPQDCYCGNGNCDAGETASNCPADCGTCGNGTCDAGETATSCPADCTGCQDSVCDLYPQCGCTSGSKCSLDTNNARSCVTAGASSVGSHCTADTDCVAGSYCLGRSDTEGQCLSWCGSSTDCSGAGGYCSDLVDANSNPIVGAAVCTITCSPANPSAACGAGFGCEIQQDPNTLELFTDCHGQVSSATEGSTCDDDAENYCAAGLFCNSARCYRWCASTADCVGGGSCDATAFSPPLTIGSTTYGVCL